MQCYTQTNCMSECTINAKLLKIGQVNLYKRVFQESCGRSFQGQNGRLLSEKKYVDIPTTVKGKHKLILLPLLSYWISLVQIHDVITQPLGKNTARHLWILWFTELQSTKTVVKLIWIWTRCLLVYWLIWGMNRLNLGSRNAGKMEEDAAILRSHGDMVVCMGGWKNCKFEFSQSISGRWQSSSLHNAMYIIPLTIYWA